MNRIVSFIRNKIEEFLQQFNVPTEAELRENFPHTPDCEVGQSSTAADFQKLTAKSYERLSDHWMSMTIPVEYHFLRCRHCGVRAEYFDRPTDN